MNDIMGQERVTYESNGRVVRWDKRYRLRDMLACCLIAFMSGAVAGSILWLLLYRAHGL